MSPEYWSRAKRALVRRDEVLAGIIRAHPRIALARRGEPFKTLARSIVGQQISVKAAESVWNRVLVLAPEATPAQMLKARRRLCACGLSQRKAEYIADLAHHFANGSIHARAWPQMDDEAVIAELIQVRGIGRWTTSACNARSACIISTASASRASACANWAQAGCRGARSPPGICGAASIRCRSSIETPARRRRGCIRRAGSRLKYNFSRIPRAGAH